MSSEEMRIELESFVNTDLREGWRGWPLKAENHKSAVRRPQTGDACRLLMQKHELPQALRTLRLFDWEKRRIRVGTRYVSHEMRS
jgi:hypothetical protein